MDLNLYASISKGTFDASQQGMIITFKASFLVAASNFYIQNVNIKREYVDYNLIITFTQLIGLQNFWLDVRDVDFNLTGTAFVSYDPLNIYFDSLYIDTYGLKNFASVMIPWNYPEASLYGTVFANDITVVTSSQRIFSEDPSIISYMGPANITASNFDLKDYSFRSPNVGGGLMVVSSKNWAPNDGLTQIVQVSNFSFSVLDNPLGIKSNSLIVLQDENIYRSVIINMDHLNFLNMEIPSQIYMYCIGNIYSQFSFSNSIFKDSSAVQYIVGTAGHQSSIFKNITFLNFTNVQNSPIIIIYCFSVILDTVSFINFNMDKTNENEVMRIQNFNFTYTLLSNLHFDSVNLYKAPIIKGVTFLNQISIVNSYFNGGIQESSNTLFSVGSIGSIIFQNHTFSAITWEILNIDKIDISVGLSSAISNINVTNSSSTLIKFGNFINPTSTTPNVLVENINYLDSEISTSINLIDTENIFTNGIVNIIFNRLNFRMIRFINNGNLFSLKHNMPQSILISNSTFINLTSTLITVDSSGSNNVALITNSIFRNWIFDQINDEYSSLINVNNKAVLEITDSSFSNIYTYEEGAVLYAGFEKTNVSLSNWIFQNISAVQGTIFLIESESLVKWTNCTFYNNFGITSTIFQTSLNGYFHFYNSSISQNYAINNQVGEMLDSINLSIMSNVSIYNNEAMSINDITSEFISKWNRLCFVPNVLAQYIINNNKLIVSSFKTSIIQLIVSSLSIQNNSRISNQTALFNIFLSQLTISNSDIFNVSDSIQSLTSNVTINSSTISKVANSDGTSFIFLDYNSLLTINSLVFENSASNLMNLRSSTIYISNFTMIDINSPSNLIEISSWDGVLIYELNATNWSTHNLEFINIDKSSNVKLSRFLGTKTNATFVKISDSSVTSIDSFFINGLYQALNIKFSSIDLISSSNFTNNGNINLIKGGAISIEDSNVSIVNSTFVSNTALIGGAISFECTGASLWNLFLSNSAFNSNIAVSQGGAIFYDYYRPTISSVTFTNNSAEYGPNFASFAFKIKFSDSNTDEMIINNLSSGNEYNRTLRLSLVDFDNQTMILNNADQISINPINTTSASIKGINTALLRNGVASFNNFIAIAEPGSFNIQFQVSSKSINYNKIKKVYSISSSNIIYANFRYWSPGEAQVAGNIWSKWSPGTYSLDWNSTQWYQCVSNAACEGGNQLYLDSGFWRKKLLILQQLSDESIQMLEMEGS